MKLLTVSFVLIIAFFESANSFAKPLELVSSHQQTTLLELFTSEGCSSCPPAEHWMNNLKHDPRLWKEIIPLAFHVDYWDYIGWKDTFASPANSQRQRRYRQEGGINTVYTPGFVSNGDEWRRRFGIKKIQRSSSTPGQLKVSIEGDKLSATFDSSQLREKSLKLNIAILGFGLNTQIRAGENAGKSLRHDFLVIGQNSQNSSTGQWVMQLPAVQKHEVSRKGIAVWVTPPDKQKPIQSVGGWLN